jgi:hypothetical protein
MAWQSRWQAEFVKPLVAQLLAIINRDIGAALADVNAAANYGPFVEYDKALVRIKQFPALLLVPAAVKFDAAAQLTRHYTVQLYLSLAVAHQDPQLVADMLEDYCRAVDEVLSSAFDLTPGDFLSVTLPLPSPPFASGATSPGLAEGVLKRLYIDSLAYDELRRPKTALFAQSATMSVICEMEEV